MVWLTQKKSGEKIGFRSWLTATADLTGLREIFPNQE